jgi:hypothetical protein
MKRIKDSATLARIAYQDKERIEKNLKNLGYKLINYFDIKEMQGYIAECEEGQVISFRGSELKVLDWVRNFNFELKDTYIGKCHAGYYNILEKSYDKLKPFITDKNILVTGHSHGGGLAIIFAKMLNVTDNFNATFIAFESPRVSDTHKFNQQGYYTINSADIVPRLPLRIQEFRHNGKLIYFNKKGVYKEKAKIARLIDFVTDFKDVFADHEIGLVENLFKLNFDKINF